jgi:hypothetical protein
MHKNIQTTFLPGLAWSLGCVLYFHEFLLRVSPCVIGTELMRDFAITGQTLSLLSGFYYYSYTPMQSPMLSVGLRYRLAPTYAKSFSHRTHKAMKLTQIFLGLL